MTAARGRPRLTLIALVILLLVDVALIAIAYRGVSGDQAQRGTASSASTTPSPDTTASSTPATTATTTASSTPATTATTTATAPPPATNSPGTGETRPLSQVVVAVNGDTAWRITVGACPAGGAAIASSGDGGKTWRTHISPSPVLVRVQPTDASKAFVVGATKDCAMEVWSTGDAGATWAPSTGVGNAWARDAADATKVRAGTRRVAPCGSPSVLDLVRTSARAAEALCADGELKESADEGATWTSVGRLQGAMALDNRLENGAVTAYLVGRSAGCAGLSLTSVRSGAPTTLGCVDLGGLPVAEGSVSISVAGNDGWLLVGDATWRSRDGLRTWSKA
jgi:hypothetical protein